MKRILLFLLIIYSSKNYTEARNIVPVSKPDIAIEENNSLETVEKKYLTKQNITEPINESSNGANIIVVPVDKDEYIEPTKSSTNAPILEKDRTKNVEPTIKDEKTKKISITNDNFKKNLEKDLDEDLKEDLKELENLQKQKDNNKVPNQNNSAQKKIVKSTNYDTSQDNSNIGIINKIEQNLLYNISKKDIKEDIEIKKGSWAKEDLKESVVKKDFKITKTSKKIDTLDVEKTEKDNKIANLKDQAHKAVQLKEYEIAIKLYKEVLKLNGQDNFTKLSLATTYHILGQYSQAKPIYIELLPVFPNSEQLISNLLSIIVQESPYEAIYLLPALASKYSNSAVIQAQTSVAFSSVERYDESIKYIKNAIYLDSDNIEYKYNLAVLYDITKNYNKAYSTYKDVYNYLKNNQDYSSISLKAIDERMKIINKFI